MRQVTWMDDPKDKAESWPMLGAFGAGLVVGAIAALAPWSGPGPSIVVSLTVAGGAILVVIAFLSGRSKRPD